MADSQAKFALTTHAILENIQKRFEHAPELKAVEWINTEAILPDTGDEWVSPAITTETLAFLQYTSGSTSAPKGVMISHKNLMYNLKMVQNGSQWGSNERGVNWLPTYHDMGLIGGR